MKARAVNPRKPHEMTRAEKAWENYEWFQRNFEHRRYEAITLRLGETRTTTDFSGVCIKTGQLCLFEIKPSDHPAVYTDVAKLRLKNTASEFPELRFFVAWPAKGSKMRRFVITEIGNRTSRIETKPECVGQTSFLGD